MAGLFVATTGPELKALGHGIVATFTQRLATQQAPGNQQAAAPGPETRHGNPCIIGTGGVEAAARAQQGAEPALVQTKQPKYQSGKNVHVAGMACGV